MKDQRWKKELMYIQKEKKHEEGIFNSYVLNRDSFV